MALFVMQVGPDHHWQIRPLLLELVLLLQSHVAGQIRDCHLIPGDRTHITRLIELVLRMLLVWRRHALFIGMI